MRLRVETLTLKQDARGWVLEPLDGPGLRAQENAHLVMSVPGCVRGNHYHRRGTEVLVALGPALVRTREAGEIRDYVLDEGDVLRFTIPPRVSHAIRNTGARPNCIIAFNTLAHDPSDPDVVPDPLIDP